LFFGKGLTLIGAIRSLSTTIYHFDANGSAVNPYVAAVAGVLGPKPLSDEFH
jgi:hypothetical protein